MPPAPASAAPAVPGHELVYSGKVRDLYAPLGPDGQAREDRLLLVASDRISAFDYVLDSVIPDKGVVLTQLSLWWFDRLADLLPNHVLSAEPPGVPSVVAGRAVLVRRLEMVPVECIGRAYLTGSALADYRRDGAVCGLPLPPGLRDASPLPSPIFTPSTKAPLGQHDEPMTFGQVSEVLGAPLAARLRELTTAILRRGNEIAGDRGILLADTKVEFGVDPAAAARVGPSGAGAADDDTAPVVVLADEVLTPDSSRFWAADQWEPGRPQTSYDKQFVRDWLTSPDSGWDRASGNPPPPLPEAVVERTRAKYLEAFERLTGHALP